MLSRTNMVLSAALVGVVLLTVMSKVDYSRPNIEVLPDMKYTPAWTSFSANPVFRNQRTLQQPVSGTIARGMIPLHYTATKEDAVRAGIELINPYLSADDAAHESDDINQAEANLDEDISPNDHPSMEEMLQRSASRGGEVYRVYCNSCHGPTGLGDGPVPKRGFPPPPSLLSGASRQMKDGQLFHILTYGQGSMPSLSGQLSVPQRWDAINYVRSLQQAVKAPPQNPAPDGNALEEPTLEIKPEDGATEPRNTTEPDDSARKPT